MPPWGKNTRGANSVKKGWSSAQIYAGAHVSTAKQYFPRNESRDYVCPVASAALANCLIQATRRKILQVANSDLVAEKSKTLSL